MGDFAVGDLFGLGDFGYEVDDFGEAMSQWAILSFLMEWAFLQFGLFYIFARFLSV